MERKQATARRYKSHSQSAWKHCPNTGVKGQINLAADFDGVNAEIDSTYEVPAGVDKTIMAWVKPDSGSSGRRYVLAEFKDGLVLRIPPR